MVPAAQVDGRQVEDFVREIRRYAPNYTTDLDLSDDQGAGSALITIFGRLAEAIALRLDRTPQKNFVAFLDRLGIVLLPATAARTAVTFRLATGLESRLLVPDGARVTAPGQDGEIPFETVGDLVAIPGAIQKVYGGDPLEDAVFGPPPNFLKPEPRSPTTLVYRLQSFAEAGAERLQLDHVTDLEPGAYLRIDCKEKRRVSKVDKGNIVTVEPPIGRDVDAGAAVTPIRDFEVFDGINLQEHVLYLGHSRVFTVKEAAEIMLKVQLADVAATKPSALDLAWQFWTKSETAPEDEGHWEDLGVKADVTAGLSKTGTMVLTKPAGLEIKSLKVNETESRWIRALLRGKLVPGTALSALDSIDIGISSGSATGIKADQGFYNATPLDLQVPDVGFFPFGTEPRQFDQFYIASKEAFSKHGAAVTLHFDLELQTLATPSVVKTNTGLRAYSIGLRRRLYELDRVTGGWQMLGSPYDAPIPERPQGSAYAPPEDAVPSAVSNEPGGRVLVFVTTQDSLAPQTPAYRLWVHYHDTSQPPGNWIDLGTPGNPVSNPAAVRLPGWSHFSRVFVVAGNELWSRDIGDSGALQSDWQKHGRPGTVNTLDPRLFVTVSVSQVLVFVNSDQGLQRFAAQLNTQGAWTTLALGDTPFAVASRPFAVPRGGTDAKVFVFAATATTQPPELFECDTAVPLVSGKLQWVNLGSPPGMVALAPNEVPSAPDGYVENPSQAIGQEGKHIFLRGSNNRLFQRYDGGGPPAPDWVQQTRSGDPELRESPAVFVDPPPAGSSTTTVSVVAASTGNSLVRWVFERRTETTPITPANRVVLLAESRPVPSTGQPLTLSITGGPQNLAVEAYDPGARLARLANPLGTLPGNTSQIEIDTTSVGLARDGAALAFVLHGLPTDGLSAQANRIKIGGNWVPVDSYSRPAGVILLFAPDTVPASVNFELYAEIAPGTTEYRATGDSGSIPELSWEYWNGRGWLSLPVTDGTRNFLTSGDVIIGSLPAIVATEVAGQENFWIRARLVGGDYGRETFKIVNNQVVSEKSSLRPPKVMLVVIRYTAPPVTPESCLTANNLDYLDQTAACQLDGAHFTPFQPLPVDSLTLFIGLDQPFQAGPVRLLLDAAERDFDPDKPPILRWSFRKDHDWKDLDADDQSVALTRQGILTLSASAELTRDTLFGQSLYWIKGTLRTDRGASRADYPLPLLRGLFLNTVMAVQGETITEEIVASSDGEPGQTHALQRADVLGGEEIRVQESLTSAERQQLERKGGKESILVRDDLPGTWVRWMETKAFFNCGPEERSYSIDRAAGELRFGDGVHGKIPPPGSDNIRAFRYRAGGGTIGNVAAGKIASLATAVAGVESVFNPTPADGGSNKTDTDQMLTIGPRQISHRGRAVSATDFEELAYEASREVAKARCLATTNLVRSGAARRDACDPRQRHEALPARGWVSLIIVPQSAGPRPCPSLELRRRVAEFLRDRAPGLVAAGARIVVRQPDYVVVSVKVEVYVDSIEKASQVENDVRQGLEKFLHPLRGGADGTGWEFGRSVSKSDVFAVLERVRNVDRVENLTFVFGRQTSSEEVPIGPNELLAGGDHVIQIKRA